jgi:hypothetical protein
MSIVYKGYRFWRTNNSVWVKNGRAKTSFDILNPSNFIKIKAGEVDGAIAPMTIQGGSEPFKSWQEEFHLLETPDRKVL